MQRGYSLSQRVEMADRVMERMKKLQVTNGWNSEQGCAIV